MTDGCAVSTTPAATAVTNCSRADQPRPDASSTCPYHNWVYDLDGRLHKVPAAHRAAVDSGALGLVPVAVAEWQGFVFVNADDAARPIDEHLNGLDDIAGAV